MQCTIERSAHSVSFPLTLFLYFWIKHLRSPGGLESAPLNVALRLTQRIRAARPDNGFLRGLSLWQTSAQYAAAHDSPIDTVRGRGVHDRTGLLDRKSTRLNSSHTVISYAVF